MPTKVRVRFAPSPTGPLHIGGVRTALFNYLFAKKHRGDFILRIEDTDQARYVDGAESYIVNAMQWLSIPFDEGPHIGGEFGPYRQSERKGIYEKYALQLIQSGHAYYAFDSANELAQLRTEYEARGETFIYNFSNRDRLNNSLSLGQEELQNRLNSGQDFVIRFKSPQNRILNLRDLIRGNIQIDSNTLDDKVLFKSDGMPTYHLANIVDDHLMEISHVIRGEEWLPSLALHYLLYDAFDWKAPEFAHLPLIMKPVGQGKLSKRDGDKMGFPVFPLEWKTEEGEVFSGYREDGYLPEAVVNMLALLGWNPGTEQELFSLTELVNAFQLERVNKAGAKFDPEKTKWFQHHYFQQLSNEFIAEKFSLTLQKKNLEKPVNLAAIVGAIKERATFVEDIWEQGSFFFEAPITYDEKAAAKAFKPDTPGLLQKTYEIVSGLDTFTAERISEEVKGWISSEGIGFGKVMMPLRLALVGEMKGPDVFEIMALLGKPSSLERIERAINSMA